MSTIPKLDPKELEQKEYDMFGMKFSRFHTRFNAKTTELPPSNGIRVVADDSATDASMFTPSIIPENVARAL
jgi:hypothetical protein